MEEQNGKSSIIEKHRTSRTVDTVLDTMPFGADVQSEHTRIERHPQPPEGVTGRMLDRDVLRIAWPSFMELVLTQLTSMADQIMVGSLPGENGVLALSAVGIAAQPKFLLMTMMQALNVGATAMVARFRGQGNREAANRVFRDCLLFNILISVVLTLAGYFFSEPMVRFMGANGISQKTFDYALVYFQIQMLGMIPLGMTITVTAVLRGIGETRTSMIYNTAANIVNVIFNYLLIYGNCGFPSLGVTGASIATVIGQSIAFVIAIVAVLKRGRYIQLNLKERTRIDFRLLKDVARIGFPSMVENIVLRLGLMAYTRTVAGLGDIANATHQICINIQSISWMTGQAFSNASTSLTGQSIGKRRFDMAANYVHRTRTMSMFVGATLGVILILFGKPIVGLYNKTPEVQKLGAYLLVIIGFTQPLQSDQFVYGGALRGAGDTRVPAAVTFVCVFVVRVGLTFLLIKGFGMGLEGAWYALAADQLFRTLLISSRYFGGKWQSIKMKGADAARPILFKDKNA